MGAGDGGHGVLLTVLCPTCNVTSGRTIHLGWFLFLSVNHGIELDVLWDAFQVL